MPYQNNPPFSNNFPAQRCLCNEPTILLCALCAVPNASLTYKSPNKLSELRNSSTCLIQLLFYCHLDQHLYLLPLHENRFSNKKTLPFAGSLQASTVTAPTQSGKRLLSYQNFSSLAATILLKDSFSLT